MRSVRLSVVVGVISLALLATAPARRMPSACAAPTMPVPVNIRAGATHTFVPGVLPSATVLPVTSFPFNPRTGTFSAVPFTTTVRIPTNAFPTNAFLNAERLTNFETNFRVNPYALAASNTYYRRSSPPRITTPT